MRNTYRFLWESQKKGDRKEDVGVGEKILLKEFLHDEVLDSSDSE
jgi:hypothetical protein